MIQNQFAARICISLLTSLTVIGTTRLCAEEPATYPSQPLWQILHAGPISLKFEDGELRYLRVGDREIIRRIYFSVREADFSTDMPVFHAMRIEPAADHFTIHFSASCRGKTVAYDWTSDITGTSDGKIIYHVAGAPPSDGTSHRIGLCVLYGCPALAGHPFETIADESGKPTHGTFPEPVSPTLVAKQFHTLRYSFDGVHVSCGIPESNFDMEDQRTWGDTSFKAYNPMPYAYPKIEKGKTLSETLTLTAVNTAVPTTEPTTSPTDGAVHVSIGAPIPGARICAITSTDRFQGALSFGTINQHHPKYSQETAIAWNWTTATHLPDDDTAMENIPAIIDQAKTIRSFAPRALLRVGPISINGRWPERTRPPGFCAAWTTAVVHALSLANIDEAAFLEPDAQAQRILALFNAVAGKPISSLKASPAADFDGFAVNDIGTTTLWLVNRSDQSQKVILENLSASAQPKLSRPALSDATQPMKDNALELSPYDVCRIVISQ